MSEHQIEKQILTACLELPAADRRAFLEETCKDRPGLLERILARLSAPNTVDPSLDCDETHDVQFPGQTMRFYCGRCQENLPDGSAQICNNCRANRPSRGWPTDALLGRTVAGGQYRVLRRLGSGGFGVVYEVETVIGNLRRALKVLREDYAHEESIRGRFVNEAVTLEKVNHPNVARCFSAGILDGHRDLYLLFELIDGTPLSRLLVNEQGETICFEPLRAVRIAKQVASGLVAAHAQHVLHRDLKPANVMIVQPGTASEHVKLLDFGIAKFLTGDATTTVGLVGTPSYMAPEQFLSPVRATPATDLWQVGVLLFVMLAGRLPYSLNELQDLGGDPLNEWPTRGPTPSEVAPSMKAHPALDELVSRLLSPIPQQRPSSASDICQELARIEHSLSPGIMSSRTALLDALSSKPSADSWSALCRYLQDQDSEVREIAEQRLAEWPAELKRATVSWWTQAKSGEVHPLWTLAQTLDLSCQGLTDEDVIKISKYEFLSSLRRLNLSGNTIGPAGTDALARSPCLERLEWLEMSYNPIGNEGLGFLASSDCLRRLRYLGLAATRLDSKGLEHLIGSALPFEGLDLSDNEIGASGAQVLSRCQLNRLQSLRLRNNHLAADGIAVLSVSSLLNGLLELDLARNAIGPAGVAALALTRNLAELRHLVLSQNGLGREGLQLLLSSAGLDSLQNLEIASNGLGANGAMALASSVLARKLRFLNLSDNMMGDTGLAALLGSPQLTGLARLDLSQNQLTSSGVALFDGAALQLDCLDLSVNELGAKGAKLLGAALAGLRIRSLQLRRTGLTAEEIGRIIQGGKGDLHDLDVSENRLELSSADTFPRGHELIALRRLALDAVGINRHGLQSLFSTPYLGNLEELHLNSNELGDEGLVELSGISALARLTRLSLRDNGIGFEGAAALAASPLASHLVQLDLSYNKLGDAGVEALASGRGWHQLQEVSVRSNGIGFGGAAALLNANGMVMLQAVDLADNPFLGEFDLYSVNQDRLTLVESSFARVAQMGKDFIERFYAHLFARFPQVKPLFARVSMGRQQQHLFSALVMIIENLRSPDSLSPSLEALSRRHVGYGVQPPHYQAFSEAFLATLREFVADEWSPELEQAWSEALEAITNVMINAHRTSQR